LAIQDNVIDFGSFMKEYKTSYIIPDTSVLLKNKNILNLLLGDFSKVIISQIVIDELNYQKDKKKNNDAWIAMQKIEEVKNNKKIILSNDRGLSGKKNDDKICSLAKKYSKNNHRVFIIHDDIGFSINYENAILLREYIGKRKFINKNIQYLQKLNSTFLSNWNDFNLVPDINYDEYLEDGNTLVINCIRSKNLKKYEKLHFLINFCNVDLNKTDSSKYFLTPLSHCIQINDYKSFCILLENGADYNKGSINETHIDYIRCHNEGNTPLMIACWHGRKKFVEKLCSYKDIGLNQQDSNGFTPLIKCAWKKNKELYEYLLTFPRTDAYIRDRNNHTAEWWMTHTQEESNGR
jgi:hypothetical protein